MTVSGFLCRIIELGKKDTGVNNGDHTMETKGGSSKEEGNSKRKSLELNGQGLLHGGLLPGVQLSLQTWRETVQTGQT